MTTIRWPHEGVVGRFTPDDFDWRIPFLIWHWAWYSAIPTPPVPPSTWFEVES